MAERKQRDAVLKDWMLAYPREGQEFDAPEFRYACETLRSVLIGLSRAEEAFEEIESYSEAMGL